MALQDTALKLIRKFGEDRQVTLLQPNTTPADPLKPFNVDPAATPSSTPVPGVLVPIRRRPVDGTAAQPGDETVLHARLPPGASARPPTADKGGGRGRREKRHGRDSGPP